MGGKYSSFDELLMDAMNYGATQPSAGYIRSLDRSLHNYQFNNFLSKEYGFLFNRKNYENLLTRENYLLYLKDAKENHEEDQKFYNKEKLWYPPRALIINSSMIKKIWNDPVFSKIISAGIIAMIWSLLARIIKAIF